MVLVLVWRQRTGTVHPTAGRRKIAVQTFVLYSLSLQCKSRTGGGFHELFECLQIQKKLRCGRCTGRTNGATLCASQLAWTSYVAVLQSVPIRPRVITWWRWTTGGGFLFSSSSHTVSQSVRQRCTPTAQDSALQYDEYCSTARSRSILVALVLKTVAIDGSDVRIFPFLSEEMPGFVLIFPGETLIIPSLDVDIRGDVRN